MAESRKQKNESVKSETANSASTMRTGGRQRILYLALGGVFSAFILLATQLKIPTAIGYANLGDGLILAASYFLGPFAFFPAAIGSALADLIAGYPVYIPATFVIKGLMGLTAGYLLRKDGISFVRRLLAAVLSEMLMVGGYFLFETLLYGIVAASGSLIANAVQGAVGIALGLALTQALGFAREKMRIAKS